MYEAFKKFCEEYNFYPPENNSDEFQDSNLKYEYVYYELLLRAFEAGWEAKK